MLHIPKGIYIGLYTGAKWTYQVDTITNINVKKDRMILVYLTLLIAIMKKLKRKKKTKPDLYYQAKIVGNLSARNSLTVQRDF